MLSNGCASSTGLSEENFTEGSQFFSKGWGRLGELATSTYSLEIEPDSAGTCGESADFCIGSFGNLETLETLGH